MEALITFICLFITFPLACGIAFPSPSPTAVIPERALVETCPKPTEGPSISELRKRQTNGQPEVCGWVNGDFASAVSCIGAAGTCMLYKSASLGMAGCCDDSRDTQNCGWARSCVDYSAYKASRCNSNCQYNSFVRKCTNIFSPYCVSFTYPADGILDYGCVATLTDSILTIQQRATDDFGVATSITLPTVSGKAVTGFDVTAGSTSRPTYTTSSTVPARTAKKVGVGLIVVIAGPILFVIFVVVVAVLFCLKKKKKQKQIAANTQAIASVQAARPQPLYPIQKTQSSNGFISLPNEQHSGFVPPTPAKSPQPLGGYFGPQVGNEQKPHIHISNYEYPATPTSNPATPIPAYSQTYAIPNAPLHLPVIPAQRREQANFSRPARGLHEMGAVNVSQPPQQQNTYSDPHLGSTEMHATSASHTLSYTKPVYEMDSGR